MNKRTAPTIIVIMLVFLILTQAGVLLFIFRQEGLGLFWSILIGLIPIGIAGTLIAVYIERIREIRDEEKDDLNKY